ncbi:MAG: hypothetical protein V4542_04050 [Pseudomonadota bacterium]
MHEYSKKFFNALRLLADLMERQTTDRSLQDRAMLLVRFASAGVLGLQGGGEG